MNKKYLNITLGLVMVGLVFTTTSCEPELDDLSLQAIGDGLVDSSDIDVDGATDGEPVEGASGTITDGGGNVGVATKAAVILNGDIETFTFKNGFTEDGSTASVPAGTDNDQDNADAFSLTPSGTVISNDGAEITSPYTWNNDALKQWILANGCQGDDSTTGGITSSENTGDWGIKFDEANRRLYQEFEVEVGVTYTINLYVRTEGTSSVDFYILNNAVADEMDLAGNSDGSLTVVGDAANTYTPFSFQFTASTTTAIFYAVPDFSGLTSTDTCKYADDEIFMDDISIATPGFSDGGVVVDPVVMADEAAVLLNGDLETFTFKNGFTQDGSTASVPAGTDNDQDNADAFSLTPSGTVIANDGSEITSPYTWNNDALKQWILANGCQGDDSTTGGVTSSENTGDWGIKFDEANRRLYQEFAVKEGVTYTIKLFVRTEGAGSVDFYILNNAVADELDLAGNSDGSLTVTGDSANTYAEKTFEFTASSSTAIFYAVPDFSGLTSTDTCKYANDEIFMDDISIETPGF